MAFTFHGHVHMEGKLPHGTHDRMNLAFGAMPGRCCFLRVTHDRMNLYTHPLTRCRGSEDQLASHEYQTDSRVCAEGECRSGDVLPEWAGHLACPAHVLHYCFCSDVVSAGLS